MLVFQGHSYLGGLRDDGSDFAQWVLLESEQVREGKPSRFLGTMEGTGNSPRIQCNLNLRKCLDWGTEKEAHGWPAEGYRREEREGEGEEGREGEGKGKGREKEEAVSGTHTSLWQKKGLQLW